MEITKRTPVRVNPVLSHAEEWRVSLDGAWRFQLDPDEQGVAQRWYERPFLPDEIQVPGNWQAQGYGSADPVELWDFRVKVKALRASYEGTGWYAKQFRVPEFWQGRRIWLNFGGANPTVEVWLNGVRLGSHGAPFVPFAFDITSALHYGAENLLTVRVHEADRLLGLAYNWQGPWSGLYRSVELTATGPCYIDQLHLLPSVPDRVLRLKAWVQGLETVSGPALLRVRVTRADGSAPALTAEAPVAGELTEYELAMPALALWSPDTPQLYRVDVALVAGGQVQDAIAERTGFVELTPAGKHFLINGEPYYLRGSGEFSICPETASPDWDRARWRRKLQALRDYGYNYIRCQSVVPTPEYFDAADEVGILIQTEAGMLGAWGGHTPWHIYQWPQPTAGYREALKWQWDRVVMRDINHPSANIYCMSNEYGRNTPYPRIAWQCYYDTKAIKPTAQVIWTDGGHNESLPEDFINAEADLDDKTDKPLIQHEFRWWSSLPDVRIIGKYNGAVRPYSIERLLETAAAHGLSHILPQAAANSQRLQYLEMKAKMEACRRDNPRIAGICHFNATDSGASPQGVLDEFYERKYATAALWQETNGDTVILSDLGFDDRVRCAGDSLRVKLSVSDFSHPPLCEPVVEWQLVASGQVLARGAGAYFHQPYVTCAALQIELVIPDVGRAQAARLEVALREGARTVRNRWDLWLLPQAAGLPAELALYGQPQYTWLERLANIPRLPVGPLTVGAGLAAVLTERLDKHLVAFAQTGGRVILAASEGLVRPLRSTFGYAGQYFFTPPANYPTYEDGQDGAIIQNHPLLGDFPHEGFADWQFYRMIANSPPLDLEPLALNQGDPVIRMIHSYQVSRPLGYLVECGLGAGSLILSALDLNQDWAEACYLLACMCEHATHGRPQPMVELPQATVELLLSATAIP